AGLLDLDVGHGELQSNCVGRWGGGEVGPTPPHPHFLTAFQVLLPERHTHRDVEEARRSAAFPHAHEAPFDEETGLTHADRDAASNAEGEFRLVRGGPGHVDLDVVYPDSAEDIGPRCDFGPDAVDHVGEPAVQLGAAWHRNARHVLV